MRRPSPRDDYNRPLTGEHALVFPADHAIRHRPVRTGCLLRSNGFVRIAR
jgi:hypothetical protein